VTKGYEQFNQFDSYSHSNTAKKGVPLSLSEQKVRSSIAVKSTLLCVLSWLTEVICVCIRLSDLCTVNRQYICKHVAYVTRSSATAEIARVRGFFTAFEVTDINAKRKRVRDFLLVIT